MARQQPCRCRPAPRGCRTTKHSEKKGGATALLFSLAAAPWAEIIQPLRASVRADEQPHVRATQMDLLDAVLAVAVAIANRGGRVLAVRGFDFHRGFARLFALPDDHLLILQLERVLA